MKTKRAAVVALASTAALLLAFVPYFLQWRRENAPPTEQTLKFRQELAGVTEVRVYDSRLVPDRDRRNMPLLFVLKGAEARGLVQAIDFYPNPSPGHVFNISHPGTHCFTFMMGKDVKARFYFDTSRQSFNIIEPSIPAYPKSKMQQCYAAAIGMHQQPAR